jgi:hypothetical protein
MFEFIAKNTGIRREKGEYVLSTNADILIHPKMTTAMYFTKYGHFNEEGHLFYADYLQQLIDSMLQK